MKNNTRLAKEKNHALINHLFIISGIMGMLLAEKRLPKKIRTELNKVVDQVEEIQKVIRVNPVRNTNLK